MAGIGKQAKILSDADLASVLSALAKTRHPLRNRAAILLSVKAGLRISEVVRITWPMVLSANGEIGWKIEIRDRIAKKRSGRVVPMAPILRDALIALRATCRDEGTIIRSERGSGLTPVSGCNLFKSIFRSVGLEASSHSGRRTFLTRAARTIGKVGGSLEDVRRLAGHADLKTTSRYIDENADAVQRLVRII